MLSRILEPELMDTAQDAEEYDAMDFSEPNTRFAEDALVLLGSRADPYILDLGTGTAQIPLLMFARRKDVRVLAVDLAQEMLRVAARRVADAGADRAIQLARLDVKNVKLPSAKFDLVLCNSTAHHIPDPTLLFREIARLVKPDGAILVRDLIRPESMDEAWATVKRVAAGESQRQQQLFFDSLCAALTVAEVEGMVRAAGLERMRVAKVSDRHWTAERRARTASVTPSGAT